MAKQIKLLLFILTITLVCNAQNSFSLIDKWLQENIHEFGGRGVIMVWKDGKVLYSHAENKLNVREKLGIKGFARKQGKDEYEELKDFTQSTPKPIASCSKWLSAALFMTFVQEGRLSLDDTIGKFLPIMTQHKKGNISIKDCLCHLTSIKAPSLKQSILEQQEYKTMEEAMESIAKMPIEGEHGKSFHYSNVGLQIVGAIVEKISGQPFETLFQQRIAIPCEMRNTTFSTKIVASPAGGAVSTAEDYLQFLSMLLNGGVYKGVKVLNEEAVIAMQQNYARNAAIVFTPDEAGNWGYGFGEWVIEDGDNRANALSSPGLFGTFPWLDNKLGYAAILFTTNLHVKGRNERYTQLKWIVDKAIGVR